MEMGSSLMPKVKGPGRLHLFSSSHQPGITNVVGFTEIVVSHNETTHFLISFSHCYNRFIFYWDGTSDSLMRLPVGRSWREATEANRETGVFSIANIVQTSGG